MDTKAAATGTEFDFEKFRLRTFVDRLIDMGEVEIHEEPVPLTGLGAIIEATPKAVLFRKAGLDQVELISKVAAGRERIAAAFGTTYDKVYDAYHARLANPQSVVEVPSDEAPVHEVKITGKDVDLTKLPFYPQHEFDGSCYVSAGIDYTIDPETGRTNVGSRRLGELERAEQMFEENLAAQIEAVGSEHPNTLLTRRNIAAVTYRQDRIGEAERLYLDLLPTQREVLGDEHFEVMETLVGLTTIEIRRGDHKKAFDWLEQAVATGHLDAATAKDNPELAPIADSPRFKAILGL